MGGAGGKERRERRGGVVGVRRADWDVVQRERRGGGGLGIVRLDCGGTRV